MSKYALTPEEQEAAVLLIALADSYLSLAYHRLLDKSRVDLELDRELQDVLTRLRVFSERHK